MSDLLDKHSPDYDPDAFTGMVDDQRKREKENGPRRSEPSSNALLVSQAPAPISAPPSRQAAAGDDGRYTLSPETCAYCGSAKDLCVDHMVPQSRGGKDVATNRTLACHSCNSRKGAWTPQEYLAHLTARIRELSRILKALRASRQYMKQSGVLDINGSETRRRYRGGGAGYYDSARRRRSTRAGRQRGVGIYIPVEELEKTGFSRFDDPPSYRVWGDARGRVVVQLYREV